MRVAQRKRLENRQPKPGEGNVFDAARWAGVSRWTIETAYKKRELNAASKKPLRFDRDVVQRWAAKVAKTEDDLAIIDIPARLPGPPGTIRKTGESQKCSRVRNIIKRLGIESYRRFTSFGVGAARCPTCIREERFPEVEAEYLAIMNFVPDKIRPDEIKISDAARLQCDSVDGFINAQKTIREALAKHAPDCVRTVAQRAGYGARCTAEVAPRAAIEAALRGEDWTPPAETPTPPAVPANGKPAKTPPAEPQRPAKPAAARKARPGRKPEWANLLKVYDRLRQKNPEMSETDLRRETVAAYNREYAGRGNNPRAKAENLRGALKSRRATREKSG